MNSTNSSATPSAYAYPLLIKHLLEQPLTISPDQEIVYADRMRMSYRTLGERINRLGGLLDSLGIGRGDTVAVMDWDSHRYLECFFAIPMSGAVLQTVNVRLSPDEIAYTLNHAGASVLFVNAEFLPLLQRIRDELSGVRRIVLIADEPTALPDKGFVGEYESLIAAQAVDHVFPDFDEHSRATTFYTTGTTGQPKGVYFSHRQIVLHTLATAAALGLSPTQGRFHRGDVYMPITPMFHVHAWGLPYVATMAGVKQVYPGRYAPETLLRLKDAEGVTFSHCVPSILMMLLHAPLTHEVDLQGWKIIIGGSALPRRLAEDAFARGIDVYTGYGMSETCPILTIAHLPAEADVTAASMEYRTKTGRPIPLVALRTVDADLNPQPRDGRTVGEVVVRAPWLTQGYLHDREASDALWSGGWLHTQDIGHIDSRGYLQVTDRIKDVIKSGGEWISSLELESIIGASPGVLEVAVVGVPDPKWGERPVALVVEKPDARLNADVVRGVVAKAVEDGRVSRFAIPEKVVFIQTLERTSVGKINKRLLRERYS